VDLVSCLTITRAARLPALARAMRAFARQTWPVRELVIVHDGGPSLQSEIEALAARFPGCDIRVHGEEAGLPLGALRNRSIELAKGALVCQWDDDDLYHPERLARQARCLADARAEFCFLTDQMHLFMQTGEMFWDDWTVEAPPMHLIQGTLFGRRDRLGRYPEIGRGGDTPLVLDLVRRGARIAELRDAGWLYVYVYDGLNAFDLAHHARISAWKRRRRDTLLSAGDALLSRLREHEWPVPRVYLPFEGGRLTVVTVEGVA
jgi:glycosyltransferase involved in cell wall biosynthesis